MKKHLLAVLLLTAMALPSAVYAQETAAEGQSYLQNIAVQDMPGDAGGVAVVTWDVPGNPPEDLSYRVLATANPEDQASWQAISIFPAADTSSTANNINLPFWVWGKGENQYAIKINGEVLNTKETAELRSQANSLREEAKKLQLQADEARDSDSALFEDSSTKAETLFAEAKALEKKANDFLAKNDFHIYVKVEAVQGGNTIETTAEMSTMIMSNWFRADRVNTLLMTILITGVFLYSLSRAKKGQSFIRRINGLDAIEEAVGRATEMGKPIFYTTGLYDIEAISTIASVFVLGEVAKKVAAYDCGLVVPHKQFLTMSVCRAVTKEAYAEAGRSDSYKEDSNFFLNPDQFAYATGVEAIITREKPAACFFMGSFAAEALLMSEVGTTVGAIQVAGTDSEDQLPFFFTSCDYTLIGEELYAAGAYLSKDPLLVSALKVQDFGKLLFMVMAIIAVIVVLIGAKSGNQGMINGMLNMLTGY